MLYQTTVHRNTHHFEGTDLVTDDKNSTFIYLYVNNIVSNLSTENLFSGSQINAILKCFSSGHGFVNNSTDM